jgi:hypothetical protein
MNLIDHCKTIVVQILHKCTVFYYSTVVDMEDLESIKDELVIELSSIFLNQQISTKLISLLRLQTLSAEDDLTAMCYEGS